MILYYAPGGGMGHLARAAAFCHTLRLSPRQVLVATASEFATKIFDKNQVISIPQSLSNSKLELKEFFRLIIKEKNIKKVFLYTFPCGILGEFCDFSAKNTRFFYVARLLHWKNYQKLILGKPPFFEKIYIIENLRTEHFGFIQNFKSETEFLSLFYPPAPLGLKWQQKIARLRQPLWVVAHSQPETEVKALLDHAQDLARVQRLSPKIWVFCQEAPPNLPPGAELFDEFPVFPLFQHSEKIFTACGFNSMKQTEQFAEKHHFIPFPRRYDDQFLRSKQRKNKSTDEQQGIKNL